MKMLKKFVFVALFASISNVYAWTDRAYQNCDNAVTARATQGGGKIVMMENRTKAYYPDTAKTDPNSPGELFFVYTLIVNQYGSNNSYKMTKCFFNSKTDSVTKVQLQN